jgi:hypothetical protein
LTIAQRRLPVALASELGLPIEAQFGFAWLLPRIDRQEVTQFLWLTHFLENELGSLNALGGVIALECGQVDKAEKYLDRAQARPHPGTGLEPDFAGRVLAETYRRRIRAH